MANVGKLKKLTVTEIRKIWPHEEKDLSVWVSENIEVLNEVLNLQIEIISREEYIHNCRLDLAGTENYTQSPVIIENQFGISNHDHLGKLITYSAAKEAGIIIWIANEFQIVHKKAVEWLNSITPQDLTFYAIELEVFQIESSPPAPNYRIAAGPPPSKRRSLPPGEITPRYKNYMEFFEKLKKKLLEKDSSFTRKVSPSSYWSLGVGRSGFSLVAAFILGDKFKLEIYIDTGIEEVNKSAFEQLKEKRLEIEEDIGQELIWDEIPGKRACRIYAATTGSIENNSAELQLIIEWASPLLIKFRKVFTPLIKNLELES